MLQKTSSILQSAIQLHDDVTFCLAMAMLNRQSAHNFTEVSRIAAFTKCPQYRWRQSVFRHIN